MTSLHRETRTGIRAGKGCSITITLCSVFYLNAPSLSPNDTKVVKVSSATLSAKRLLEGEDHTRHAVPVPYGSKDAISKPGSERIKH